MFEDLTNREWIVNDDVVGVAERPNHTIKISGSRDNAVVACLNRCGPYGSAIYDFETGRDRLQEKNGLYEIVRDGRKITFTTGTSGPVTGSWTANDSGGDDTGGAGSDGDAGGTGDR
jgi:hypothetical protein